MGEEVESGCVIAVKICGTKNFGCRWSQLTRIGDVYFISSFLTRLTPVTADDKPEWSEKKFLEE